jgi:predicted outer membrane repeat protein
VIRNTAGFSNIDCKHSGKRAFTISQGTFTLQKVTISNCGSFANNGGAFLLTQANVDLRGVGLSNNKAKNGGGIYAVQTTLSLTTNVISNNIASVSGGGIWMKQVGLNAVNTEIHENTPNDIRCDNGSAQNTNSHLGVVKCTSCFIPNLHGAQTCT